jgi:hypothetical protein
MIRTIRFFLLPVLIAGIQNFTKAQVFTQKLLPSDKAKPGWYGSPNGRHSSMAMDDNTIVVGDAEWYSYRADNIGCSAGYGAVDIFKKNGNAWQLSQTFYHTSGSERKFGGNVSLKNNVLAVTAEREDMGSTVRVGCVFVYRRNDPNSYFTLLGKVYPSDGTSGMDFGNSSVATNGQFVASGSKNGHQKIYVFRIEGNLVNNYKIISTPGFIANQLFMMGNNNIVALGMGTKSVKVFRQSGSDYAEITSSALNLTSPYETYTGKGAFDGNTLVAEVKLSYLSTYHYYKIIKINSDNTVTSMGTISVTPYMEAYTDPESGFTITNGSPSITIKENKWIFISANNNFFNKAYNLKRPQILAYRYYNGKYFYGGAIDRADDGKSSLDFGEGIVCNTDVLAVCDKADKSNGITDYNKPCNQQIHPGAVSLFNVKGDNMSWENGFQKFINPLADNYDKIGYDAAISGNYAIVGSGDNDYSTFNGACMLYKKENGQWNYIRKLQYHRFYSNARTGDEVDISDKAAVAGAFAYENYGAVFSYPIIDQSGRPIEEVKAPQIIKAPDAVLWDNFGYDVSTQGNSLVISAPERGGGKGAVYYYTWDNTNKVWIYKQTIMRNDLVEYDRFGYSIDVYANYLLIGCPGKNTNDGRVYLYKLLNGTFTYVTSWSGTSGADERLGNNVSISADHAIIGGGYTTKVRMLSRSGDTWSLHSTLTTGSVNTQQYVSIDGTRMLVSTHEYATGMKVTRYELYGNTWTKSGAYNIPGSTGAVKVEVKGDQAAIACSQSSAYSCYVLFGNYYSVSGARESAESEIISEESEVSEILASPNPLIDGRLYIHSDNITSAELTSVTGETHKLEISDKVADTGKLEEGIYILTLHSETGVKRQKIVIKK